MVKVIDELVYDEILMCELDGYIEWYDIGADLEERKRDDREYGESEEDIWEFEEELKKEKMAVKGKQRKKGKRGKRKEKKISRKKSRKTGVDA